MIFVTEIFKKKFPKNLYNISHKSIEIDIKHNFEAKD